MTVLKFDELYVVSDLHLGGAPDFQILNQGDTPAWVRRHIKDLLYNGFC